MFFPNRGSVNTDYSEHSWINSEWTAENLCNQKNLPQPKVKIFLITNQLTDAGKFLLLEKEKNSKLFLIALE